VSDDGGGDIGGGGGYGRSVVVYRVGVGATAEDKVLIPAAQRDPIVDGSVATIVIYTQAAYVRRPRAVEN
jgi:hypothetical protein